MAAVGGLGEAEAGWWLLVVFWWAGWECSYPKV